MVETPISDFMVRNLKYFKKNKLVLPRKRDWTLSLVVRKGSMRLLDFLDLPDFLHFLDFFDFLDVLESRLGHF